MSKGRKKIKAHNRKREKMVRLSLAVALLMPVAEVAHAQAVVCTRALTYGSFASGGGGGTITVTPNTGKVLSKGGVVVFGTPLEARCLAKSFATTSASVSIKVSAKTTNIKGAGTMVVKNFNIATVAGGPTKIYTAASLTTTPLLFGVGGELHVNNGQALGAYSGSLTVTVTFTP